MPLLVEDKDREKFRPSILQLDHEENGVYYVNAYSLTIERDEDFMPLMQVVYDKLSNYKVLYSSIGKSPYNPLDPTPLTADDTFSYDVRQK